MQSVQKFDVMGVEIKARPLNDDDFSMLKVNFPKWQTDDVIDLLSIEGTDAFLVCLSLAIGEHTPVKNIEMMVNQVVSSGTYDPLMPVIIYILFKGKIAVHTDIELLSQLINVSDTKTV